MNIDRSKYKFICFKEDGDIIKALDEKAAKEGTDRSAVIRRLIRKEVGINE